MDLTKLAEAGRQVPPLGGRAGWASARSFSHALMLQYTHAHAHWARCCKECGRPGETYPRPPPATYDITLLPPLATVLSSTPFAAAHSLNGARCYMVNLKTSSRVETAARQVAKQGAKDDAERKREGCLWHRPLMPFWYQGKQDLIGSH